MKIFSKLKRRRAKAENPETRDRHGLKIVGSDPGAVIVAVGGGKGGVGKSMVTANLGIMLAQHSCSTLLVDVDLGAANLHSFLGMDGSRLSLSSFLKGEVDDFGRLIRPTEVEGLDIVTAAMDSLDVADLEGDSLARLQEVFYTLDYDYIVLDLGPGTSANVLDMLFCADHAIIITTPDPMSVENTYRYLKAYVLRRIKASLAGGSMSNVLQNVLKDVGSEKIRTVADIILQLRRKEKVGGEYVGELMGNTNLSLLMNQTRSNEDCEAGSKIVALCDDNLGMKISHIGNIPCDEAVVESVVQRKPLSLNFKGTDVYAALEQCVDSLQTKTGAGREAVRRLAAIDRF